MINDDIILPDDFKVPKILFMQDFLAQTLEEGDDGAELHLYRYAEGKGGEGDSEEGHTEFWMYQGKVLSKEEGNVIQFTRVNWRGGYYMYQGKQFTNPPNVKFLKYLNDTPSNIITWEVSAGRMGGDIWEVKTRGEEVLSIEKSDWSWVV